MGLSRLRGRREEKNRSCGPITYSSSENSASDTSIPADKGDIIGSSGRRKMRIADFLREPDDAYDDKPCSATGKGSRRKGRKGHAFAEAPYSSSPCTGTPIWVLSRWLASVQKTGTLPGGRGEGGCLVRLLRGKGAGVESEGGKAETEQETMIVEGQAASPSSSSSSAARAEAENGVYSTRGAEAASVSELKEEPLSGTLSERLSEKASFNFGLGAGLIFLLARNSDEYKKTLELRREMDMILQEIKNASQDKNALPKSKESKDDVNSAVSDSCGDENPNNCIPLQDHRLSFGFIEPEEFPGDQHEGCPDYHEELGNDDSVDQLEKEIQSELELLQLGLDKEEASEPSGYQGEEPCGDQAEMMDESHISESYTAGSDEIDPNVIEDEDISCQNGVCPIQLERRLHELLQARQKERIEELEFALRAAETKLREKEMEIAWWRDTVRLVSNRNPENHVM